MDNYANVLVIRELVQSPGLTQRDLSRRSRLSLGKVNKTVRRAQDIGLIDQTHGKYFVNEAGKEFLVPYKVSNAIIMAAGFGSRCVPLTYETPKGLLPVNGRPMIESQIEQLLDVGISDITVIVGYMKEKFDYLIDRYGVSLVYNPDYATKNNIASVARVLDRFRNTYLLCSDNYIEKSIFHAYEPDSWFTCLYMEGNTDEWCVTSKRKDRILKLSIGGHDEWTIVGPAYFSTSFSRRFATLVNEYMQKAGTSDYYWEHILKDNLNDLEIYMNRQSTDNVHEFENLEELRQYDLSYIDDTRNSIMECISEVFSVTQSEITDFIPLKAGVTNQSFVFAVKGQNYVFRLPGIGTSKLINRHHEKSAYNALTNMNITDEIVYFNAASGIKISKYYKNSRIANPDSDSDLQISMQSIRKIHNEEITIKHDYDIQNMINYYKGLAENANAIHFQKEDYEESQLKLQELFDFQQRLNVPKTLCHGDYAHTNVLFLSDGESKIIDWEYAGMSDPMMDVSMFAIYAELDKEQIDKCLHYYCNNTPSENEAARCYLYVALGGFLWCMWSEYKQSQGQEFGEYPLKMYRYFKDYYRILKSKVSPLSRHENPKPS